jgi:signal transduction histidine kinase
MQSHRDDGRESETAILRWYELVPRLVHLDEGQIALSPDGVGGCRAYPEAMDRWSDWSRGHPKSVDATLAMLVLVLAFAGPDGGAIGTRALFAIGLTVPLVWRRVAPRLVFTLIAAVALVQYLSGTRPTPGDIAILIALYTVAVRCSRRDTIAATVVVATGSMLASVRWSNDTIASFGFLTVLTLATALSGETIRVRRAYLGALEARAAQLERDRDQQALIAVAAERSRIARELHDIVAHNVSVMIAQADGAQYAITTDPDRARDAMVVVARTGREALAEMRHIVGVLRPSDESNETEPQPDVDRIADLIDRLTDTGYAVTLTIEGVPEPIPAGPALAAYRIVQESLTNTFKHAGPDAKADVTVAFQKDHLRVCVDDDGCGPDGHSHRGSTGAGHGLVGMRERVAMYNGSLDTGHRADGGYSVIAELELSSDRM